MLFDYLFNLFDVKSIAKFTRDKTFTSYFISFFVFFNRCDVPINNALMIAPIFPHYLSNVFRF